MKTTAGIALGVALVAGSAQAAVMDKSPAGFEVVERVTVAAPQARVWTALMRPGAWWSSKHTWSGDAKNLTLDLTSGCFCETLAHGYVRHMTVTYVDGASQLRMFGGLGPLQSTGAAGHMAITLKEAGGETYVDLAYDVGGYAKGGLAEGWAEPVDQVLGQQLDRLKRYVETGKPD